MTEPLTRNVFSPAIMCSQKPHPVRNYGDTETQPTYSVGDRVELGGKEYEIMGIVKNIRSITEGVSSSTASFGPLSIFRPRHLP